MRELAGVVAPAATSAREPPTPQRSQSRRGRATGSPSASLNRPRTASPRLHESHEQRERGDSTSAINNSLLGGGHAVRKASPATAPAGASGPRHQPPAVQASRAAPRQPLASPPPPKREPGRQPTTLLPPPIRLPPPPAPAVPSSSGVPPLSRVPKRHETPIAPNACQASGSLVSGMTRST